MSGATSLPAAAIVRLGWVVVNGAMGYNAADGVLDIVLLRSQDRPQKDR